MVNCCTQAHILKQESLCQKVHVALENRWCGSELIRSGCPVALVRCQKSQAKIPLLSFASPFGAAGEAGGIALGAAAASLPPRPEPACQKLAWVSQHCGVDISFGCNNNRRMRYVVFRGFGATGC